MTVPTFDPTLATTPVARRTDPDTSHDAGHDHAEQRQNDRKRALDLLRSMPNGLTDFELGELMHRQQTSAGKRRGELRDQGVVRDSGRRRAAPSGAKAIVWEAVPEQDAKTQGQLW